MGKNVLSNLGYEDIIEFLIYCGCKQGRMKGDDLIFYHPNNKDWGISVNHNRKYKKSGYPIGTLLNNIRTLQKVSGVTKQSWIDWFGKKRDIRKPQYA